MANTTLVDELEEQQITYYNSWGIIISVNSWLAFTVNVLHLVILTQLKTLTKKPYRHILIHITLGDMFTSLTTSIYYTFLSYFFLPSVNEYSVPYGFKYLASTGLVFFPLFTCYWIFVFASIEQYYAICQPMKYETSSYIKKLPWILWAGWLMTFLMVYGFLFLIQEYSFSLQSYQRNMSMGHIIFKLVPLLITIIFLIPILKELRKMAGDQIPAGREQARNAAIYLIIIFSIFSMYSLFDIAVSLSTMVIKLDFTFLLLERIRNMIKTWYAILNTIIYGWRTKTYRQYIRDRLQCHSNGGV